MLYLPRGHSRFSVCRVCYRKLLKNNVCVASITIRNNFTSVFHESRYGTGNSKRPTGIGKWTKDMYANPLYSLQPLLEVAVLPPEKELFKPVKEDVIQGSSLFITSSQHDVKKIASIYDIKDLPDTDLPEVAFCGRSNVGKSSLIKAMFQSSNLPKIDRKISVSKKPGHTKTLQFFTVGRDFTLVDMPGFGINMPAHFTASVEVYLRERKNLCRTFLLIDVREGLTKVDLMGIEMLESLFIPYVVVLTKIDNKGKHETLRTLWDIMKYQEKHSKTSFPQPFLVSAVTGEGVAFLQSFVAYITGSVSMQGL